MDGRMLDGLWTLIIGLMIIAAIAVPLAIWKLVELVVWAVQHIAIV